LLEIFRNRAEIFLSRSTGRLVGAITLPWWTDPAHEQTLRQGSLHRANLGGSSGVQFRRLTARLKSCLFKAVLSSRADVFQGFGD